MSLALRNIIWESTSSTDAKPMWRRTSSVMTLSANYDTVHSCLPNSAQCLLLYVMFGRIVVLPMCEGALLGRVWFLSSWSLFFAPHSVGAMKRRSHETNHVPQAFAAIANNDPGAAAGGAGPSHSSPGELHGIEKHASYIYQGAGGEWQAGILYCVHCSDLVWGLKT